MSKMQELYEKVAMDSALLTKFTEIIKDVQQAGEEATKERLVAFAGEEGYHVTVEELQEFFKGPSEIKEGELSEADMDQVAGGKGGSTSWEPYLKKIYEDVIKEPVEDLINDPLSLVR